jgi:putative hydroxymethylpyrimidine transport system substrate-binding protein
VLLLSACGVKQEAVVGTPPTKPFTVLLDRPPNGTQAALYTAGADGAFRAGGLAVQLQSPTSPGSPLKLLESGEAQMAIATESEVLLARDRGVPVVSIAALVQQPLAAIIALPRAGIAGVANLAHKRVGTGATESQEILLDAQLAHAQVAPASVSRVPVGFGYVPATLSTKVDATFGGFSTYDALAPALARRHPTVIAVTQAGVPSYSELLLVVRQREAEHDGEDLRTFMHALTLGQSAVKADPASAAALVAKASPSGDPRLQLASIQHTLPLEYPISPSKPYGYQLPNQWESFALWMYAHRILHTSPATLAPPFTNEFLPGQGP